MSTHLITGSIIGIVTFGAVAFAGVYSPPVARADLPANCDSRPWGFLGRETRVICDSPIRPDGYWTRNRIIGIPAHYENATSHCSNRRYYSNCTYYPGGWVSTRISSQDTYQVRADNVLPDEPGHMPDPAPLPPPPENSAPPGGSGPVLSNLITPTGPRD
ncbi:hypothetical protein [Mycobacterium sp. SMC-14]|uniref:CDGP domain-containing protein n=1 Tax=Mycobacterium sp. SMC-14 TaxID=3385968 RepID=UPI00390C589E